MLGGENTSLGTRSGSEEAIGRQHLLPGSRPIPDQELGHPNEREATGVLKLSMCKTRRVTRSTSVPHEALAQPARARLFAVLAESPRPASTEALAEEVGLHANGVRRHLERLRQAGLVTRTRERQPRGRPRDEWAVAPDARPEGDSSQAHADLARWLARAIPPRPGRLRDVEATGREIGRDLAPTGKTVEAAIHGTLSALGFQPETDTRGATISCTLGHCPYRDAVMENPEVICTLHRGITRGLLDALEPNAELVRFVPRDPDDAGCLIEVGGVTGTSSTP